MASRIVREFSAKDGVGVFLLPQKELDAFTGKNRYTYCGLEELYEDHTAKIDFDPVKYKLFDGGVQDYLETFPMHQALWKPNHEFYTDYEPIRKNLALVRNGIYLQYFPDGIYDPYSKSAATQKIYLEEMGKVLGATLKRESFFRKALPPSSDPLAERRFGDYGIEHIGAAEMYKALLRAQNKFTLNPLRWLQGKFNSYDWNLADIENTVFRQKDIEEALFQETRKEEIGMAHPTARLAAEALMTQRIAVELLNPAALRPGDAELSVELAHDIIEALKRMKFDNTNEGLPGVDQQAHDLERGELIAELAMAYQNIMADLAEKNPAALHDPELAALFETARLSFGKLGHLTYVDSQRASILESQGNDLPLLDLAQLELPKEFQYTYAGEERQLLANIEQALSAAIIYRGKRIERAAQVEINSIRKDYDSMHQRISWMSAHIASASENLVGEAKAINQTNRMMGGKHEARVVSMNMQGPANTYRA